MNKRQQALYDAVLAEGGQMWIEQRMLFPHKGRAHTENRAPITAMESMVEPKGRYTYTPGGFARHVVLRLLKEQKIEEIDYNDPKHWMIVRERYLIEAIPK